MRFWKVLFGQEKYAAHVKKEYKLGEFTIQLLNQPILSEVNANKSNIIARNKKGEMIWIAEIPYANFLYFNMQVDEDANVIIGDSGAGRLYHIDLNDGKIIQSVIQK